MGRKHLLCAMFAAAPLTITATPVRAAPPIAYTIANNTKSVDLFLVNPDGTGRVRLYTTAKGASIHLLDMNPIANQVAIVETDQHVVKLINYSAAGVAGTITTFNDPCFISGIDFHPTNGSLLVSHWCPTTDTLEVRQWSNGAFDSQPLATFGSGQTNAIGQAHWLGDGSGFLIFTAHAAGTTQQRQIDWYTNGLSSAPVTVVVLPRSAVGEFDTARCTSSSTGPCSAMIYDDGAGQIHKVHFDAMSTIEDSVQAGSSPHFSPNNAQLLYRLQTHAGYYLKVDNFTLVSKAAVYAPLDWHP